MENLDKQADALFSDIRTAYRLIYEYQKRVLDLVFYLRAKFNFPNRIGGFKHFSDPIRALRKYKDANLKIFEDMWAWDFLYSYAMEYYFEKEDTEKNVEKKDVEQKSYRMSVLVISDSGFFCARQQMPNKQNTHSFNNVEDSETLFFLIFECTQKNKEYQLWYKCDRDKKDENIREWCLSSKQHFEAENDQGVFLVMKVPMQKLMDKTNTDAVIAEFANYVKEHSGINLTE